MTPEKLGQAIGYRLGSAVMWAVERAVILIVFTLIMMLFSWFLPEAQPSPKLVDATTTDLAFALLRAAVVAFVFWALLFGPKKGADK